MNLLNINYTCYMLNISTFINLSFHLDFIEYWTYFSMKFLFFSASAFAGSIDRWIHNKFGYSKMSSLRPVSINEKFTKQSKDRTIFANVEMFIINCQLVDCKQTLCIQRKESWAFISIFLATANRLKNQSVRV